MIWKEIMLFRWSRTKVFVISVLVVVKRQCYAGGQEQKCLLSVWSWWSEKRQCPAGDQEQPQPQLETCSSAGPHSLRWQPQTGHTGTTMLYTLLSGARFFCCFVPIFLSFVFPSYISGVHHFWVRFLRMWLFFNPTIKVVTFCLRGWCVLGVFLLPAFTRLGHERQDLLSPCDEVHVCTD